MENPTGTHLWLVLWKAYAACQSHAQRSIETLGMCYSDFAVLECLLHKGSLPVNVIGEKVSLTSGSITTAVDRLQERGLVERQSSEEDRRTKLVTLTGKGRKLIKDAFERHEIDMERLADSLSKKERTELVKLMKKLGKAAASFSA
jgi:MarR family 2-MHQ and catechol resistance regulon transcriptional repressor